MRRTPANSKPLRSRNSGRRLMRWGATARRRIPFGRSGLAEDLVNRRRLVAAIALLPGALAISACKIVATPKKQTAGADDGADAGFNPNAKVAAIWDARVIPYLSAKAHNLAEVVAAVKANPD